MPSTTRLRAQGVRRALTLLAKAARAYADRHARLVAGIPAAAQPDAANLLHYLAVRSKDLRSLQQRLTDLGLSSLARGEAHVLATIDAATSAAVALAGDHGSSLPVQAFADGRSRLKRATRAVFGPPPRGRAVRLMVTLPSTAASDDAAVRSLIAGGMDIARINCAHDDATAWRAMVARVRRLAATMRRRVRIVFELAGPKLRTEIPSPGSVVFRWKTARDRLGIPTAPARITLVANLADATGDDAVLPLGPIATSLRPGDRVMVEDTRGKHRVLSVVERVGRTCIAECAKGARVINGTVFTARRHGRTIGSGTVQGLSPAPGSIRLRIGDLLVIGALPAARWKNSTRIDCGTPEVYAMMRPGERVVFDDGRLAGIARATSSTGIAVEITVAPPNGATLRTEKGINLPDSTLHLPALTADDHAALTVAVGLADVVGLSFVGGAEDVHALQAALPRAGPATMFKIETAQAFAALPQILLAGLQRPPFAVMIARGDLAAEAGFARMAEVQEEMLWLCEAARVPVVWATQVLDRMAKKGIPTRAEVTDAAMAGRAECVMLNKGPHMHQVLLFLADLLKRMASHQDKKRAMLSSLTVGTALEHPTSPAASRRRPIRTR